MNEAMERFYEAQQTNHLPETYAVGELVHYSIGSDTYPAIVTRVTRTTVTVQGVKYRLRDREWEADRTSYREDIKIAVVNPNSEPKVFRSTKHGLRYRGHYCLGHGFCSHTDPHR